MKLKSLFTKQIVIILGLVIIGLVVWYWFESYYKYPTVRMTAKITALDNACWFDGMCTITLDNGCRVEIEYGGYLAPDTKPEVRGTVNKPLFTDWSYQNNVGKQVELFVRKLEPTNSSTTNQPSPCWLSVFGSSRYYVKVL